MKLLAGLNSHARALRTLTGLPLAHCVRIMVAALSMPPRRLVPKRRAALRQPELSEQLATTEEVLAEIRKIRSQLAGGEA